MATSKIEWTQSTWNPVTGCTKISSGCKFCYAGVIVGGESGRTPRPMKPEWVEQIKEQCQNQNTAFYFKQWGGTNKKKNGRLLDGKEYNEMPKPEVVL